MNDQMQMAPMGDPPKKNNTTMYIIIGVVAFLCCCCVGAFVFYQYLGDPIVNALGIK